MVSYEGACLAYFKYGKRDNEYQLNSIKKERKKGGHGEKD
jgi:hypothetical protein